MSLAREADHPPSRSTLGGPLDSETARSPELGATDVPLPAGAAAEESVLVRDLQLSSQEGLWDMVVAGVAGVASSIMRRKVVPVSVFFLSCVTCVTYVMSPSSYPWGHEVGSRGGVPRDGEGGVGLVSECRSSSIAQYV